MTLVLIVEDNPINRDVLGRRLERRGYSIRFAEDGPSGIAAAKTLMPDVILMDIGLGEMDGCEATRRIRADPETAALPIIALTASAFESDRANALAAIAPYRSSSTMSAPATNARPAPVRMAPPTSSRCSSRTCRRTSRPTCPWFRHRSTGPASTSIRAR